MLRPNSFSLFSRIFINWMLWAWITKSQTNCIKSIGLNAFKCSYLFSLSSNQMKCIVLKHIQTYTVAMSMLFGYFQLYTHLYYDYSHYWTSIVMGCIVHCKMCSFDIDSPSKLNISFWVAFFLAIFVPMSTILSEMDWEWKRKETTGTRCAQAKTPIKAYKKRKRRWRWKRL